MEQTDGLWAAGASETIGLTSLWRHPDSAEAFGDDMTVYPDHAAALVASTAILAALIERDRTGLGRRISVAQFETVFGQLATDLLRESLQPGTLVPRGNVGEFDAPSSVYACAGEDGYCAISVDGDQQWRNLATAIGREDLGANPDYSTAAGRVRQRDLLDTAVAQWIAPLSPRKAQNLLQAAGVPAGAATHVKDLLDDPQLSARRQLGQQHQPGYSEPLTVNMGPALFENIGAPDPKPAPMMAANTLDVCRAVLGMSDEEIDELHAAGVLELPG